MSAPDLDQVRRRLREVVELLREVPEHIVTSWTADGERNRAHDLMLALSELMSAQGEIAWVVSHLDARAGENTNGSALRPTAGQTSADDIRGLAAALASKSRGAQ